MNVILDRSNDKENKDIESNKEAQKKKVGRNEKCPCGSEKKFKHCCGSI